MCFEIKGAYNKDCRKSTGNKLGYWYQARTYVVSSLPGNTFLVWKGMGRTAKHASCADARG